MSDESYAVVGAAPVTPAPVMPGLRVAILGTGKMGGILLQAFLKNNLVAPEQIFATVHHAERAQALGYKMGQLKILELRDKAKIALGPKFDIKAFHDEVLDSGALPMDVLEQRLDAWIAAQKQ